jgi:hypothetical protein
MNHGDYIYCANRNCEAECGVDHAATFSDPAYADLSDGAVMDDRNGDVFCSQECYDASHPTYCADCGDEVVRMKGDRCTYCTIVSEQGEDAAYAWYRSQHPELLRKPVTSVSAVAAGAVARRKLV